MMMITIIVIVIIIFSENRQQKIDIINKTYGLRGKGFLSNKIM